MSNETSIEWASHSWNPYTWNCTKVSQGCKNCYALARSQQYQGKASNGGDFQKFPPRIRENAFKELPRIPSGAIVFVNSHSDTYHEEASLEMVERVHTTIAQRPDVTFLLLTKRPARALDLAYGLRWPKNLWIGTSVENRSTLWRLDYLMKIPAYGHFVSAEPLLEEISVAGAIKKGLKWVICGGESGQGFRYFDKAWARVLRDECQAGHVPFLFKQGSAYASGQDRLLDGRTWNETPLHPLPDKVTTEPTQLKLF